MAGVPQKTLNWLYDVLKREYHEPNRTYSDLAHLLARNPGFAPRTDVYTFENGVPALLVHFKGIIPVHFRGNTYRFPIALWVPHAYPYEAPICYVTPTDEMVIRPGQYVGGDGKIYHPYLAHWREAWDRSNIPDFLSILSDIFAKEPPVVSRTPQQQQRPVQPLPPPVPPLPREMQPPSHQNTAVSGPTPPQQQTGSPTPPPPPPKPSTQGGVSSPSPGPQAQKPGRYDAPPPLPPEVQAQDQPRPQHSYGPNGSVQRPLSGMNYMPQRISSLRQSIPAQRPSHQQQPHQPAYESPQHRTQPVRPGEGQQYASPAPHQPLPQQALGMMGPPLGQGQGYDQSRPLPDQYRQPPAQGHHGRPLSQHHPTSHPDPPHQPQQPLPPKPIQPNLLDSPFDIPLPVPTSTTHQSNVPAPPIPRNPEKEALLTHLSHQLTTSLHSQITQSTSALPALSSQNAALQSTLHTLTSELQNLQTLHSTLTSNLTLLRTSLSKSDNVISTAHARAAKNDIPAVDEMLTPPNVVARQLYDAACEERGIEAAILALQEGFVCGRVPAEVWSRRTRELAREGFKRRWMERKVASGMGLDLMAFRS